MKLVFASTNAHKLREVRAILGDAAEIVGGEGLPPVDETGDTFEANALLKATSASRASGLPAMADDSGLEVDALKGRPGVHSARYGGPGLDDRGRRATLLDELAGVESAKRTARFVCAIALVAPGAEPKVARGVCEGRILLAERGSGGFGYDPLFVPKGHEQSFGELPPETKNRLSHRAAALAIAKGWL